MCKKLHLSAFALAIFCLISQSLNATSLEEAIKSVDISGVARYRYDTGIYKSDKTGFNDSRGLIASKQDHRFLSNLGVKVSIDDNFKVFGQLRYGPTKEDGYSGRLTNTKSPLMLRQSYLEYDNSWLNVIGGKQQMDGIWSENYSDGLVGVGAKFTLKLIESAEESLKIQLFVYDSYGVDEQGGQGGDLGYKVGYDTTNKTLTYNNFSLYNQNLYGAAILSNFGNLKGNLWFGYIKDSITLYALDLGFKANFSENASVNLAFNYLGNVLQAPFKREIDGANGNFFGLKGTFAAFGFDASLGGMFFGKKDKYTLTVLEDTGDVSTIGGQEIIYTDGTHLTGAKGQNTIGYFALGYSFYKFRIGADVAYGQTKMSDLDTNLAAFEFEKADKLELVGRLSFKPIKNLNFIAFYSYLNVDASDSIIKRDGKKNTTRVQAVYRF